MRSGSPLVSHGPRKCVQIAQQAATNATLAATRHGLTQRIVLDELLLDVDLVERAARRLMLQNPSNGTGSGKTTHQDCAGRTREAADDP